MTFTPRVSAAALVLAAVFLPACTEEKIEEANTSLGNVNCAFEVPRKMRTLSKAYNKAFSAPDADGNSQSYETCKAGLKAAEDYRSGLTGLLFWAVQNCPDSSVIQDNLDKMERTGQSLNRQIDETDCESTYGK